MKNELEQVLDDFSIIINLCHIILCVSVFFFFTTTVRFLLYLVYIFMHFINPIEFNISLVGNLEKSKETIQAKYQFRKTLKEKMIPTKIE